MDLSQKQKKGQQIFKKIISEAWQNEDFKKSLLLNPEETLETFFGGKLPFGKKIKVTDQTDSEYIYINIPIMPSEIDFE